jgi:hypothetical protein
MDDLGVLFPGKNPGDSYSGSFTLDTNATQGFISDDGAIAAYSGGFDVTIESVSYPIVNVLVFSSGPFPGASDGFELYFDLGILTGFLGMRSSSDIYAFPLVPGAVDLADMDEVFEVALTDYDHYDRGSITTLSDPIPEPATALLLAAGLATLASRRRAQPRCDPRHATRDYVRDGPSLSRARRPTRRCSWGRGLQPIVRLQLDTSVVGYRRPQLRACEGIRPAGRGWEVSG